MAISEETLHHHAKVSFLLSCSSSYITTPSFSSWNIKTSFCPFPQGHKISPWESESSYHTFWLNMLDKPMNSLTLKFLIYGIKKQLPLSATVSIKYNIYKSFFPTSDLLSKESQLYLSFSVAKKHNCIHFLATMHLFHSFIHSDIFHMECLLISACLNFSRRHWLS